VTAPMTVLAAVLKAHGSYCGCTGACGTEHSGRRCMAGITGKPIRLTAAPYPPYATDQQNASAPASVLRPWCGPCWTKALRTERDRVADQRRRELEEGQFSLFGADGGAAA
jgi:hypothetical protein